MPSTLAALSGITSSAVSIAAAKSCGAPVAGERRIEHVAEPVQDHRLVRERQDCGRRRSRSRRRARPTRASARLAIRMTRPPSACTACDLLS